QLFRRECLEAIGGYLPMKAGGIDLVAVLSARLNGWQTRTFPEQFCEHHRKQGSAKREGLAVILNDGKKDYLLGAHPVWEFFRAAFHMRKRPYLIGGACLFVGYFWPMLLGMEKAAPREIIVFRRQEQSARLREILRRYWFPRPKRGSSEV